MIGIYKITSKSEEKIYIGRAEDIKTRWAKHKRDLKAGVHINKGLQGDYDWYGSTDLEFEVLQECTQEEYRYKELFYIMNSKKELYNVVTVKDKIVYNVYTMLLENKFKKLTYEDIEIDFKTEKCKKKRPLNWNICVRDNNSNEVVLFNLWKFIPDSIESQEKVKEANEIRRKFVSENDNVHMINLEYTDTTNVEEVSKAVFQQIFMKL